MSYRQNTVAILLVAVHALVGAPTAIIVFRTNEQISTIKSRFLYVFYFYFIWFFYFFFLPTYNSAQQTKTRKNCPRNRYSKGDCRSVGRLVGRSVGRSVGQSVGRVDNK